VVILPVKEYLKLIESFVPAHYLSGRAARDLDLLAKQGLRDYRLGRTKKIKSLADLD
jgi:hypothetical protein